MDIVEEKPVEDSLLVKMETFITTYAFGHGTRIENEDGSLRGNLMAVMHHWYMPEDKAIHYAFVADGATGQPPLWVPQHEILEGVKWKVIAVRDDHARVSGFGDDGHD